MCFDIYCIPMNIEVENPAPEYISDEEIYELFQRVEQVFALPDGTLQKRNSNSDKLLRRYGNVNLSDVRAAFVLEMIERYDIGVTRLGRVIAVDHSSIIAARDRGYDFTDTKDENFSHCREKTKSAWKARCELSPA